MQSIKMELYSKVSEMSEPKEEEKQNAAQRTGDLVTERAVSSGCQEGHEVGKTSR